MLVVFPEPVGATTAACVSSAPDGSPMGWRGPLAGSMYRPSGNSAAWYSGGTLPTLSTPRKS